MIGILSKSCAPSRCAFSSSVGMIGVVRVADRYADGFDCSAIQIQSDTMLSNQSSKIGNSGIRIRECTRTDDRD